MKKNANPKHVLVAAEPVSAYEAKTHLPSLLQRAAAGEHFVITRHGKPVARLIPYESDTDATVQALLETAVKTRRELGMAGVALRDVLEAGEEARDLAHADHRY